MNEEQNNVVEQVEQQPQDAQTEQPKEVKTFTQEQVDEIVKKRLAKEQSKFEQRLEERINQLEEAQKLSQLSDDERKEVEYNKRVQELEAREKALKEKENAYNKQQYQNEIESQLKQKGLPTDLADLLVGFDAETVASKIDALAQSMGASVSNQIQEKLKSTTTPQEPTVERKPLMTLQEIQALSPQEYMANRELVEESLKSIYKK